MDQLAAACEDIQRHASRLKKVSILAEYFKTLDAKERALAVQLLSSGSLGRGNPTLFETGEKLELKIGRSVLREALRAATGWDKETLSVCHAQVGDTGETVGLMMRRHQRGGTAGDPGSRRSLSRSVQGAHHGAARGIAGGDISQIPATHAEVFRKDDDARLANRPDGAAGARGAGCGGWRSGESGSTAISTAGLDARQAA